VVIVDDVDAVCAEIAARLTSKHAPERSRVPQVRSHLSPPVGDAGPPR
jgi:hypothetical protein